jgi:Ala-tRNA(Pro) deacylase
MPTEPGTLDRIRAFLAENGVAFRELHHEPTRTSEESASVRGEPLEVGAKAIVMKVDERFLLLVLSAARKLDTGALRKELGARRTRFATPEELLAMTGLVPGAVPPFGRPILDFDLYVDASIDALPRVAYNAGSLTDSIIMNREDYRRVAGGKTIAFSKEG